MTWNFDNSFARLPDALYRPQRPDTPPAPRLVFVNHPLAERLGLTPDDISAGIASGAVLPCGAEPLAQAYAGHQFGTFVPRLGDGRALLLGEQIAPDGARFDIALKGSGPTDFSRRGDGKLWLGPALREAVLSEAVHALGLPSTRVLALALTGERVLRDAPLPGAVLIRTGASHIRIGSFEYLAARRDKGALAALCAHVLARHFPGAEGPESLLRAASQAQADLVAGWMAFGFIHGVMNTDNMALSGETIDYGPAAFMETYAPGRVFSAIDRQGRYAYGNQPAIAQWNLGQLAGALLPLMPDEARAIDSFTQVLDDFPARYQSAWLARFGAKLGLRDATPRDVPLTEDLLRAMARGGVDFTRGFADLRTADWPGPDWHARWTARLNGQDPAPLMARANPQMIPRLHQLDAMAEAALSGDFAPFERIMTAVRHPFDAPPSDLMHPAPAGQEGRQTTCGT